MDNSFELSAETFIPADTAWVDEIGIKFTNITDFASGPVVPEERFNINLYSEDLGSIVPTGIIQPEFPIGTLSEFIVESITLGREEETDSSIKIRLENADNPKRSQNGALSRNAIST